MHPDLQWHLAPERLYLDCWTRVFLRTHVDLDRVATACNIGVGRGELDDWLGAWLKGRAVLTSVDIDADQVRALHDRQRADGHPNPSVVAHADLLQAELGPFDLVVAAGSTLHETHAPARAIRCARAWVKPSGLLMFTLVHTLGDPDRLLSTVEGIEVRQVHDELPTAASTSVLIRC